MSRGRIPVGARFSAPVQTGPGNPPSPYTKGTGSFPGVKRPERGVDPAPHLAGVKERIERYLYFSPRPTWLALEWTLLIALLFMCPRNLKFVKRKQFSIFIAEIHSAVPGGQTRPPPPPYPYSSTTPYKYLFVQLGFFVREWWNTHLECCQIENTQYGRQSKNTKHMAGTMTYMPPARWKHVKSYTSGIAFS